MDDTQLLQALETLFGGGGSAGGSVPVATILPFAGSVAPEGFMVCDGTELLASEYGDLFAAIGITYGVGQAAGSFKLPNLRGRAPVGAGQGDGLTDRVMGSADGAEVHQLTIDEMPVHDHAYDLRNMATGAGSNGHEVHPKPANSEPDSAQTRMTGGDQPHNNMQPFLVVNYIIKV